MENFWVAGRCLERLKVHGSIRVQPAAAMMARPQALPQFKVCGQVNPLVVWIHRKLIGTLRAHGAISRSSLLP